MITNDKNQFELTDIVKSYGSEISSIHLSPEHVFREGIIYVKEGIAKIYGLSEKGHKVLTEFIHQGEIFPVNNSMYETIDNFFLEGLKYTRMFFIKNVQIPSSQQLIVNEIKATFYMERLKRIHQQNVRNYDLGLRERLLYFLFDLCLIYGKHMGNRYIMPNYFTHEDLSFILKNCRQNVTSCLNKLKREGIIFYNRKEVMIEKYVFEERRITDFSAINKSNIAFAG